MRSKGFTLIEIAVVLVVAGFIIAMGVRLLGAGLSQQQRYTTNGRLAALEVSLATYTAQHQRLPCPADGALPNTHVDAGTEVRNEDGDCPDQARGVAPWRALGISEQDAMDGYFGRITYRVAPGLTRDGAMNFAACDPAGAAGPIGTFPHLRCNSACTTGSPLASCTSAAAIAAGRGLEVRGKDGVVLAGPAAGSGAAYVLVSHGPNRVGGYGQAGVAQEAVREPGVGELQNRGSAGLASYYADLPASEVDGPAHFDDIVRRPTIMGVAYAANLGPRAH